MAIGKTKERKKERKLTHAIKEKLSAKRIKRREMMVSSRLLRKSEKSSPSLVLRNSTPWFFAAICFLWASFLTVAMLSNEQSLGSRSRADETRGGRESDGNELVKREKRKEEKIPSLASEYHRREEEDDDDEDKRRTRRIRGPLAGAYRRHGLDEDQVGVQERKVQGPKFRGPFGRFGKPHSRESTREERDLRDEEETTNGARRERENETGVGCALGRYRRQREAARIR